MSIKNMAKKVIGAKRLSNIKGIILHYVCSLKLLHDGKLKYDTESILLLHEICSEKHHVFRGYYDLNYYSNDKSKFLCHRLPINANNNRDTECEIGFYDLPTKNYIRIVNTSAWCWQQGSRLRWHPLNKNWIVFNDVSDSGYCTRIYDISTSKYVGKINRALYDITPDFKYGLSLNYSRLQRLRPGYGYNFFDDETKDIAAPDFDGIFLVDINSGENKLLYSLKDLSASIDNGEKKTHYVNHISISPEGTHFIFFHIYVDSEKKGWNTILYASDIAGSRLKALEKKDRVSHYCWINNEKIMITCHRENGEEYYCEYDINTGDKKMVEVPDLVTDGHPNPFKLDHQFITDTYPLHNSIQKLKIFKDYEKASKEIAWIYHDYRLRGERRCDLHPSLSTDKKHVSVDTTYHNKKRSILIFEFQTEDKNA